MLKRLVVAVFVTTLTIVGLAPAATAAPSGVATIHLSQQMKPARIIDWD